MFFGKSRKTSKKGFSLIELLAAVVILGIIVGLSIPLLKALKEANKTKKFNAYSESMMHGAKLYLGSYEMDVFGDIGSGCTVISYNI